MEALIAKLEAWTEASGDFHSDRQLADEILIADSWMVIPDSTFAGGFRWEWRMPSGGAVCSSEASRPHPINDMNAAIGVVPMGMAWSIQVLKGRALALVWNPSTRVDWKLCGNSERPTVALVISALRYIAATRKSEAPALGGSGRG